MGVGGVPGCGGRTVSHNTAIRLHTTNKTRNPTMQYIHIYVSCSIEYVCVLFLSRDIQNGVYVLYSIGQDSTTNNCIVILIAVACEKKSLRDTSWCDTI